MFLMMQKYAAATQTAVQLFYIIFIELWSFELQYYCKILKSFDQTH